MEIAAEEIRNIFSRSLYYRVRFFRRLRRSRLAICQRDAYTALAFHRLFSTLLCLDRMAVNGPETSYEAAGDSIILSAQEYVRLARSSSLRVGGRNHGKSNNLFQPVNARSFAAQVVEAGAVGESTCVVLMPESPEVGTKATWLAQTEEALKALPTDNVRNFVKLDICYLFHR